MRSFALVAPLALAVMLFGAGGSLAAGCLDPFSLSPACGGAAGSGSPGADTSYTFDSIGLGGESQAQDGGRETPGSNARYDFGGGNGYAIERLTLGGNANDPLGTKGSLFDSPLPASTNR